MKKTSLLYGLLYGPPAKLRPYEVAILQELGAKLLGTSAKKLKAQLNLLVARRQTQDRVLLFQPIQDGVELADDVLFNNKEGELLLCNAALENQSGKRISARVFSYKGRLSTIQLSSIPGSLALIVKTTTIVADPDVMEEESGYSKKWTGLVERFGRVGRIQDPTHAPLSPQQRQEIIQTMGVELPDQYLEVIEQADGLNLGKVKIFG